MPTCLYLHPLRSIRMTWEIADDIPTLTDYELTPPVDTSDVADADVTIIHSNDVIFHRMPGQVTDRPTIDAECAAWLPEITQSPIRRVIHPSAMCYGSPWTAILAVHPEQRPIDNVRRSRYLFDIETDIVGLGKEGRSLFVGRRGHWIWVGAVNDDGSLAHLDRAVFDPDLGLAAQCCQVIDEMLSTTDVAAAPLFVFGDIVDPTLLRNIATHFSSVIDPVQRFNPFHRVRSALTQDKAADVLRRAHLIGTVVGAM